MSRSRSGVAPSTRQIPSVPLPLSTRVLCLARRDRLAVLVLLLAALVPAVLVATAPVPPVLALPASLASVVAALAVIAPPDSRAPGRWLVQLRQRLAEAQMAYQQAQRRLIEEEHHEADAVVGNR